MLLALAATAALGVGYVLGRIQPLDRLDTWVWRRLTFGGPWVRSRWQQLLVFGAHAVVRPRATVHAWRHRNDPPPPPPRSPVPTIRTDKENR
ncbi:hypothetical protein [Streptomyces sp. NPDC048057]|uniref:hypothetical protein n=1 Tax=Streptomyces sp. NPDC048057 TaxID=3155628 RepID=UPI0033F6630A